MNSIPITCKWGYYDSILIKRKLNILDIIRRCKADTLQQTNRQTPMQERERERERGDPRSKSFNTSSPYVKRGMSIPCPEVVAKPP